MKQNLLRRFHEIENDGVDEEETTESNGDVIQALEMIHLHQVPTISTGGTIITREI